MDYYKTLEINKNSSKDEIKKAYRKLAHKYHPDKKGGDEKKFKEINEAYGVLSNDKKKAEYDAYGRVFSGAGGQQQGGFDGFSSRGGQSSGWEGFSGFAGGGQGVEFDLGDIFSDFFGGASAGRVKRGRDISIDIEISFKESVFGTDRKVLLKKKSVCDECSGTGAKKDTEMKKCNTCNGSGKIHEAKRSIFGAITHTVTCKECRGSGEIPKEKCNKCKGGGIIDKQEELKIRIPSSIEDGEMIRQSGGGEAISEGMAGDLYIKIHVKRDSKFRKEGANIITNLDVKLSDAILGGVYKLEVVDEVLDVKIPEGVTHGDFLKVKGKGVVIDNNKRGDLLIKVSVKSPKKLSKKARELLEELKKEGI